MQKNYSTKHKDINLPIRYTEKPITAWGGPKVMARWSERIHLRSLLEKHLEQMRGGSNRAYDPAEIVLSFIVSVFMGAARLCHTYVLHYDEPVKRLFGFEQVPSVSTFSRFFRRFTRRAVEEVVGALNDDLIQRMRSFHPAGGVTIDFDSSVFDQYGKQEGAVRGYNPKKPGRPSHHPLFALIAEWKWVLHLWLRRGNTVSGSGAIAFEGCSGTLGLRVFLGLHHGGIGTTEAALYRGGKDECSDTLANRAGVSVASARSGNRDR